MFVFGDPADIAKMYLDTMMEGPGPKLPDLHFEEMEEQDLRYALAWLHAAATRGFQEGLEQAVLDVLVEWFDEVFVALAELSEDFRAKWAAGTITPPGGQSTRAKYARLVRKASEN